MKKRGMSRVCGVAGAMGVVVLCGVMAGGVWADDGWDGVSPNFGLPRGVNQAIEEYDQMSRTQSVRQSQDSNQHSQVGSTDIRANRLDRKHNGVVDVNERQVSRDRVIQLDQNQSGQSQSGDRHGVGPSKHRRSR